MGRWGGRGRVGGQSGCERRIEVFVKIQKKKKKIWGGGGRVGLGGQSGYFVKIQKKKNWGGGGSGGGGGRWGRRGRVGGSEWM